MMNHEAVEAVQQVREMEVLRGLRAATSELQGVAQDFFAMGDDWLADEANILCGKIGDLLMVVRS